MSFYDGAATTNIADSGVDHNVALPKMWHSGVRNWNSDQRRGFASGLNFVPALLR